MTPAGEDLSALAHLFLALTAEAPEVWRWQQERAGARSVLREVQAPGYDETRRAWDVDWLCDLLAEVER